MDYNLSELESIFNEIENVLDYVDRIELEEKSYILFLANNDRLKVKINKENIAHLLGINTDYLKNTGHYNGFNSFEILQNFIKKGAYKLNELKKSGIAQLNQVFSGYVDRKAKNFIKNMKFDIFNVDFMCKYNSERSYTSSYKNQKFDYIMVKTLSEDVYGVLCLVKNRFEYVPMSSQIFIGKEELDTFLQENIVNQEITLLNGISYKDYSYNDAKIYNLVLPLFFQKIENLKDLKNDFNCIIDTTQSLIYHLKKYMESNTNKDKQSVILKNICEQIKQGKLIDKDIIQDESIIGLIDSYNNFICNKDSIDTKDNKENYITLKEELKEKKNKILELEETISMLKSNNEKLLTKNETLEKQINDFDITRNEVIELLKKPKAPKV